MSDFQTLTVAQLGKVAALHAARTGMKEENPYQGTEYAATWQVAFDRWHAVFTAPEDTHVEGGA